MLGGYIGKVLRVNLTDKTINIQTFSEDTLRKYIGGSGLGTKILYDETDEKTDPLGPENRLIFMTGPMVGLAPNFGRHQVISKSPLTGSFGEANSGGTWGYSLKKAGYDGIVFVGKSKEPVYLNIYNGTVEIKDAKDIWGKDTYEVDDILKEVHGKKTVTCSIGQAGENLSRIAAIMNDGYDARAAGRCGLGAVMGSKNLKAISLNGTVLPRANNPEELKKSIKKWAPKIRENTKDVLGNYGTSVGIDSIEKLGNLPIKNFSNGNFNIESITGKKMAETILVSSYHCAQCAIGCGRTIEIKEGPYKCVKGGGPEYETIALLGPNCMIDNLEAISLGNELCNRYGLDTISTGNCVAFAMEAYENGLLTKEMLGGVEAKWGDPNAMIEIIKKIAFREDFGNLLAEGTRIASERLGGLAPEFVVHVKGMEFPAHDPRAAQGIGIQFATSTRGACHLNAFLSDFEFMGEFMGFGYGDKRVIDRFSIEGQAAFCKLQQDVMALFDSLTCCKFLMFGLYYEEFTEIILSWLEYIVGWKISKEEFIKTGERIFNLKRLYQVKCGVSRKDDVMPPKIKKRRGTGGSAKSTPNVDGMLDEYYELRGWNEYGIPTKETRERLSINY